MHSFSYTTVTKVLVLETNALKTHVQTSAQHSYICSYQQFSRRASLEFATHRDSPSKTGSSHALMLTCEYATPTNYLCNSLFCWTKPPSSHQVDKENDKQTSPCTPSSLYMRSIVQVWRDYTCHTYTIIA